MRVALIYPIHLLERYGWKTNYHMTLPHLAHIRRYQDFFQRVKNDDYIILDNGAAEGVEFGARHLHTVAEWLGAHEIVVPDDMGDCEGTISKALAFSRYADPQYRYMGVIHGQNMSELLKCLSAFVNMPSLNYITTIGVPRLAANTIDKDIRIRLLEFIHNNYLHATLEFHALGASYWLEEVKELSEFPYLRGIDTSTPIHMGLAGHTLKAKVPPRPENFFEIKQSNHVLERNIQTYLDWCRYTGEEEPVEKP